MRFEELKKKLKEELKPFYIITGSDLYLKQKAEELIKDAVVLDNAELNSLYFSTDKLEVDKVIDACNTMPFFASKKIVIIKEYEKKSTDNLVKRLEEYCKSPNDTTCLLMIAEKDSTYFDPLKKLGEVVDCNPLGGVLIERIIEAELNKQGKKIELIARQLLIDYCLNDLSRIHTELKKLVSFIGEDAVITAEMVKNNVSKDLEFEVYELTGAMSAKNAKDSFIMLNQLLENKNTASSLFSLIYRHFRRMFYVLINTELSLKELSEKLEVKEFAVKKATEQAKNFGVAKLKAVNELCVELDYKTKIGKLDPQEAIKFFVLTILNM